jgi:asparagine synthase (glutamine-hydrolysing)
MVFDGGGGDNVFGSLNSAAPVVDAFLARGAREAFRALRDIASLHGCTLSEVARAAVRRWRRRGAPAWPMDRSFLRNPPGRECFDLHPWLADAETAPPGSAQHIRMIAGAYHFFEDPRPGEPVGLHPLLAQPIVELCLGTPSWFWSAGGRDRAVARAAFRGLVPDQILDRRSKGTLESMFLKAYMARKPELRELLVSGLLVDAGIVDGAAIKAYLDRQEQPRDTAYIRILEIASAEQWLRSFDSRGGSPEA